jgi:hypothetical protein
MRLRRYLLIGLVVPAAARGLNAQQCDSVTSRTSLAEYSGREIRSLRVVPLAPDPFPGPARVLEHLHIRTRQGTVRRQLLIAPGDTVDTLRVAESLRKLRRLSYLADAAVTGVTCGTGPVDLTIVTRDAWSTRPSMQVRSTWSAFELTERNVVGTGREATLGIHSAFGRTGIGVALRDPWFLGSPFSVELGRYAYRDGSELVASIARRDRSVLDPWGFEAQFDRSARIPASRDTGALRSAVAPETFRRTSLSTLLSRRLAVSEDAVLSAQAGAEYRRAELTAAFAAPLVGPGHVRRDLVALDLGLRRRSVAFDTVTWLLPSSALVDVPLSLEADALIGTGYDRASGVPTTHVDVWVGKMFVPAPRSLLTADLWTSGYRAPSRWSGGSLRGSLAYFRQAPAGLWTARLAAERLFDPDPDVRALASADPATPAFPERQRFAEGAASLSVERSVRLLGLSRSWALDGASFGAWSTRWDAAARRQMSPDGRAIVAPEVEGRNEYLSTGVLGVGLRLSPRKAGRATARLDIGYPVVRMGDIPGRPFLAIGISPWLDQGRRRDER